MKAMSRRGVSCGVRGVPKGGVPKRGVPMRGVPMRGVPMRGVPKRGVCCADAGWLLLLLWKAPPPLLRNVGVHVPEPGNDAVEDRAVSGPRGVMLKPLMG